MNETDSVTYEPEECAWCKGTRRDRGGELCPICKGKGAGEKRRVVWAKTRERETEHFMGMKMYDSGCPEGGLTGEFLKALKKARAAQ